MARDITLDDLYFTSRRVLRPDGHYYTAPFSNVHQYINGYLYTLPTTVASAYFTSASATIISRFQLTSPAVKLTITSREISTGELQEGTFETSIGSAIGTYLTILGNLSVGFNYFSGLYTQSDTANVRVIITLQQEF